MDCPIAIRDLSKDEFDERDALVMRCAYAAQNTLGRLLDERVYENDLALRLQAEGCSVHTQVPITVSLGTFEKTYRCDLIAGDALYELKTVIAFNGEHEMQALHYAMMLGIGHTKLLNFRTEKVQGRLRFNALSQADRHRLVWGDDAWQPLTEKCEELRQHANNIIRDWGAYLDCRLYHEALRHFMGGELACVRRVAVMRDGIHLGTHPMSFHADGLFFVVTALTTEIPQFEGHLRRLMRFTASRGAQWVNLNHNRIQFITLK
jgi:GxxExxY protein